MAFLEYNDILRNQHTVKETKFIFEHIADDLVWTLKRYNRIVQDDKTDIKFKRTYLRSLVLLDCEIIENCMVIIGQHIDKRGYRVINLSYPELIKTFKFCIQENLKLPKEELTKVDKTMAFLLQLNRRRNVLVHGIYENENGKNEAQDELVTYLNQLGTLKELFTLLLKYHPNRIAILDKQSSKLDAFK